MCSSDLKKCFYILHTFPLKNLKSYFFPLPFEHKHVVISCHFSQNLWRVCRYDKLYIRKCFFNTLIIFRCPETCMCSSISSIRTTPCLCIAELNSLSQAFSPDRQTTPYRTFTCQLYFKAVDSPKIHIKQLFDRHAIFLPVCNPVHNFIMQLISLF